MSNYVEIAYCDEYFMSRLYTAPWDDADNLLKTKALGMASNIIDKLNYIGDKTDSDQERQFPRAGDTDVPRQIKQACCEIALALLDGVDPEIEYTNLFMTSDAGQSLRATFDRSANPPHIVNGVPSFTAWTLLVPFLRDGDSLTLRRVD